MASPSPNADFNNARPEHSPGQFGVEDSQKPLAAEPFTASTRSPFQIPGTGDGAGPGSNRAATLRIPRERAYRLCGLLVIGDWIASSAAIFSGLQLREWQRMGWAFRTAALFSLHPLILVWSLGGGALFVWLMAAYKTYEVRNLYRLQLWSRNLAKSVVIWCVAAWAYIGLLHLGSFAPRIGVVYCAVALGLFATVWRLISFTFLMQTDVKEAASSRVIVVGWNEKASHLRAAMRSDVAQLREIVGCVTMPDGTLSFRPPPEVAVLGNYPELSRLIAECGADSIILSDVTCSAHEILLLILFCQREMIGFQMVPEYFPTLNAGLQVQTMSGVPLLGVGQLPLDKMENRMIKRIMDIVGSLAGLGAAAVLLPVFGLLVYLEAPGPLLRRERRASRSGRVFDIYKLRTGRVESGIESPTRRAGFFVQKYHIDELPQFWNVLVGDMSLVGPSAEPPELIERLKDEVPNYSLRHEVRAGLTGWSQISENKGDTDIVKRINGDLYYLRNWNVMVDIYCIAATLLRSDGPSLGAPARKST